ncbi:MAG: hypothetical protein LLF94_00995 [Chlamydiales bacterium]|nr:hypothetical protein [Chlamydiales bacterium]
MYKLLCLLLLPLQLLAFDLKQDVKSAVTGDYIVYAYKNSLVLFRIRDNVDSILTVEEISAPNTSHATNWQEWITKNAPGHTSWTISRINTATGKVESIFSVDERRFLNANPAFQFLPTLFQLTLMPIDKEDRKLMGPQPQAGEVDMRRLWLPKIVFEQKQITPPITPYRVRWPKDESELAGKPIDLYFAQKPAITYLPYWIEVFGGFGKAKISALDSGSGLSSPIRLTTYEQSEI